MAELKFTEAEIKLSGDAGVIEGYGSLFGQVDSVKDMVIAGAFRKSLQDSKKKGRLPSLLWQHDPAQPIGKWTEMREDSRGLYVKGQLFVEDIQQAKEAHVLMKEGAVDGLSIGYRTRDSEWKDGVRLLKELDLIEVSVVTMPALDTARVSAVKTGGKLPTEREFEEFLRDAGFSRKEAAAIVADGFRSLCLRDAGADEELMNDIKRLTRAMAPSTQT
jgi:HK97 family phage prohead protease